jgi:hypothetical protein
VSSTAQRPPRRWRRARVTAARLPATSRPHCRPSAGRVCPSRLVLSLRRSSWEKPFAISPPRPMSFALLRLRRARHAGELLLPPISSRFTAAAAPSRHSYLSSCAGPPVEARNRHIAASLSSPTAVTGESFTPCALVQSPPLVAMPHPSGRFPFVPEAREAL